MQLNISNVNYLVPCKPLVVRHPVDEALLKPGRPSLFPVFKGGFPLFVPSEACFVSPAERLVTGGLPITLPVVGGPLFVPGFAFFAGICS